MPSFMAQLGNVAGRVRTSVQTSRQLATRHANEFVNEMTSGDRAGEAAAAVPDSTWAIPMHPKVVIGAGVGIGLALLDLTQDRHAFTREEKLGTAITWGVGSVAMIPVFRTPASSFAHVGMGGFAGLAAARSASAVFGGDDEGSGSAKNEKNGILIAREAGAEGLETGAQVAVYTGVATFIGVLAIAAARRGELSLKALGIAGASALGAAIMPSLLGFGWGAARGAVDGAGMAIGHTLFGSD